MPVSSPAAWFLDTGFVIAVASKQDQHHAAAMRWFAHMQQHPTQLVTSDAVLFEIGAAFSKASRRAQGAHLIRALLADPKVEVVGVTQTLREQALVLFERYADKDWSLCDCLSICLMHERSMAMCSAQTIILFKRVLKHCCWKIKGHFHREINALN